MIVPVLLLVAAVPVRCFVVNPARGGGNGTSLDKRAWNGTAVKRVGFEEKSGGRGGGSENGKVGNPLEPSMWGRDEEKIVLTGNWWLCGVKVL